MTAAARLKDALKIYREQDCGRLSRELNIPRNAIRRAMKGARGQATHACHYVTLCLAAGVDPVTGACVPRQRATFDQNLFAIALRMRRAADGRSLKLLAKVIGVSEAVLSRMENGDARSFECTLKVAKHFELNLWGYIVAVSHETVTGKTLIRNTKQSRATTASP